MSHRAKKISSGKRGSDENIGRGDWFSVGSDHIWHQDTRINTDSVKREELGYTTGRNFGKERYLLSRDSGNLALSHSFGMELLRHDVPSCRKIHHVIKGQIRASEVMRSCTSQDG